MVVLEEIYRAKLREFEDKLHEMIDEHTIYVTDLVSCSHKRVLRRAYPLLAFRFEPQIILGDMVHAGVEKLVVESSPSWRAEVHVERVYEVDGTAYRVLGRVDLVQYDGAKPIRVVEVKTARTLPSKAPYEHHVMQLKVYLELMGVDEGYLVYITPERITEFRVERGGIDVEELVRQTVYDVARPRFNWECRYCSFKRICPYARPEEGRGEAEG